MEVVTICSIFRDSGKSIERYLSQIVEIYPMSYLRFSFVEGDSTDKTFTVLDHWSTGPYQKNVTVTKHNTHTRRHGSVVDPERFKVLTKLANLALCSVSEDSDYILWLESDLIIPNFNLLKELIKTSKKHDDAVVAPFILINGTKQFYDVWGFRKDNQLFAPFPPYCRGWPIDTPFEVDTAGSVLLVPYKYIEQGAKFEDKEVIVGLCKRIKSMGGKIVVDPYQVVYHP